MHFKNLLSFTNVAFVISQLFMLVRAGYEIQNCFSNYISLTNVNECSKVDTFVVKGYCISNSLLLVLGDDEIPLCYHPLRDSFNLLKITGKDISLISSSDTISFNKSTDLESLAMFSCYYDYYNNLICVQTSGVIIDIYSKLYSITKNSTIENSELNPTSRLFCSRSTVGEIIKIKNKIQICVNDDLYIPINTSSTSNLNSDYTYHIISSDTSTKSPFSPLNEKDNNILLQFSNNRIIHDITTYISDAYVDFDTRQVSTTYHEGTFYDKMYTCSMGTCTAGSVSIESNTYIYNTGYSGVMYTFENNHNGLVFITKDNNSGVMAFLFDANGIGIKIKEEQFSNRNVVNINNLNYIYLLYCQKGDCIMTEGYLKYSNNGQTTVVYCGANYPCITPINVLNNKCPYNGIAYYDTNSKSLTACINNKAKNALVGYTIAPGQKNYIFDNYENDSYYLLESDETGNIVGYSRGIGAMLYDVDGDGNNDVMRCYYQNNSSRSVCYKAVQYGGYYIDLASNEFNDLIYCMNKSCSTEKQDNGYFTNSDFDIIMCNFGVCYPKTNYQTSITCNYHNAELIPTTLKPVFCLNNKEIKLEDEDAYYIINNIDPRYTYPNVVEGDGEIFVKVNKYSITQITTSENGICYNDSKHSVTDDEVCSGDGLLKYYCSSICLSCKTEKQKGKYDPFNQPSSCVSYLEDDNLNSGAFTTHAKIINIVIVAILSIVLLF